ncbi:DnaT-like ssDNA-binding domain-containing protein [Pseudomonas aeruginosa]|uniref:DnaT-like ssDNA-binding domain-containing protein n=1 Tax=Pseudomonas aeruginosa TaxID=287 RepID=UPI00070FBE32|nr:DnaT-like ssDNA-binding domain-containing protein [Pseudomonas aeruginosa]
MPSFQINDEEREALRGLPMLAREIYVFALRPFMDFVTGIVGERRGISWKSIAEELYVEPHQGIKGGDPSEKELRRALVWLQKVGLVGPNLAERRLIFELPKASRDQSVRKKVGTKWADEVGSYAGGSEPSNYAAFMEEEGRYLGGGESEKVGTPPVSDIPPTTPPREAPQPGQRFPMHDTWLPSARGWPATLTRNGMKNYQLRDEDLLEFRSYWINRPEKYQSQGQWEHELAQKIRRNQRFDQNRSSHGNQAGNAEGQAGHRAAKRGFSHRQSPRSAVDRVNAIVAANEAARQAAGTALGEDDRDVRAPLDVEFWRQPEP